jgi:hypothetical protein
MNEPVTETLSVIVEREVAFPPEKIWRALTQPHLIEEWLMKNDFKPVVDHRFNLRADWGAVDCQVLAVEPALPEASHLAGPVDQRGQRAELRAIMRLATFVAVAHQPGVLQDPKML